jgi:hypothetical protein
MAMEIFVFSDSQIGSMVEWQEAVEAEGFALRLSTDRPFNDLNGHLPAQLNGEDVWFECDHFDLAELIAHYSDVDFGHPWEFVLAFRIGASFKALLGAWIAATAYAKATGGTVFDETDAKLYPLDEALKLTRDLQRDIPRLEQQVKELQARPQKRLNPSQATISVRIVKAEEE